MRPVVFAIGGEGYPPAAVAQRGLFITCPERLGGGGGGQGEGAPVVARLQMVRGFFAQVELGCRRAEAGVQGGSLDDEDEDHGDERDRAAVLWHARTAPLLVIVLGRIDSKADRDVEGLICEAISARQMEW